MDTKKNVKVLDYLIFQISIFKDGCNTQLNHSMLLKNMPLAKLDSS